LRKIDETFSEINQVKVFIDLKNPNKYDTLSQEKEFGSKIHDSTFKRIFAIYQ
jgi:hypothetical protein